MSALAEVVRGQEHAAIRRPLELDRDRALESAYDAIATLAGKLDRLTKRVQLLEEEVER